MSLDEDQLDADIAGLDAKLAGIRDQAIRMGLDQGEIDAAIAEIKAQLQSLRGMAALGINQGDLDAVIAEIQAKLTALGAEKVNIRIGTTGAPEATAEVAGLAAVMKTLEENSGPLVAAITGLANAIKPVGDESDEAALSVRMIGSAAQQAGEQAHAAGGWMGMLTHEVTLFGGALGDIHMVGAIPLWHILLDGIMETTIGLVEATVALTAFGLAAAPAAEDIYNHIKSVDDVVHTLGIDIPPVTGHLHDLGQALAPQILELYGGAMNMMSSNGSTLATIVTKITTGFDDWMAKLDMWQSKQDHADGLISAGGELLSQMAQVLDNLGLAFENLMKADPGTVHFLGDVAEAASKLIELFTELPTPLMYSFLAIHSFMLWGGLLTTGLAKILTPLGGLVGLFGKLPGVSDEAAATIAKVATGVKTLGGALPAAAKATEDLGNETEKTGESASKLPPVFQALNNAGVWGWAGLGVAALGGLVYWMTTADSATKAFIANLDNGLASLDPGQAVLQIGTDIGTLDHQITTVGPHIQSLNEQTSSLQTDTAKNLEAFAKSVPESLATWSNLGNTFAKVGATIDSGAKSIVSWFGLIHSSMDKTSDIDAYNGAIVSLTKDQDNLFHEVGNLMQVQVKYTDQTVRAAAGIHAVGGAFTETTTHAYTYTQALALMGLAGVQASDKFSVMQQKVENLIRGYEDMSVQGGILANSVNAVTFSTEQQDSKVTALTQGWTAFIGLVTGGMSGFSTFETQVAGLGTAATDSATIAVSAGKATIKSAAAVSSSYTSTAMSASSANSAVTSYTNNLVKGSKAQATATSYQQKLTASLQSGGDTATQAKNAVDAYTQSVTQNGVGSSAQAAARGQLLKDLTATKTVASQASSAVSSTTGSLDGVNAASLQLQQTWVGAITDGSNMMNSLLEMASAAGLGAKGTTLLTQAGKDMVSQLLPMAKGSSDATAQLYALAQQAGYQGPDSFQSLVTWVGKTKDAEQNLQEITSRLTVASADLAGDVENLANAMNQNLNQAMSAAIFQASGGQSAFDAFATAALKAHGNLGDMKSSATQLATELLDTIGNTTQAHNEFDTFATQLGLTKQQADKLWASVVRLAQAESRIPPTVKTVIQITEQIEQAGGTPGGITGINNSALPRAAHGMLVQGGIQGKDSRLVMTMPGELIVPTQMVQAGEVDHLRGRIPGFAKGGVVPSSAPAAHGDGFAVTAPVVNANFNYYGTQHPTPEMRQAFVMDLTMAVGVAG